jgi:predicted ATPase
MLGDNDGDPTTFEVSVLFDGIRYDYGFSYTKEEVVREWLYSWPKNRQRLMFERNVEDEPWRFGEYLTGRNVAVAQSTRRDALFLSTARLLNHEELSGIHAQFAQLIRHLSSEQLPQSVQSTMEALAHNPQRFAQVKTLMTRTEFGIVDLKMTENQLPEEARETTRRVIQAFQPELPAEEIDARLQRTLWSLTVEHSGAHGPVALPFDFESVGTRNFFALLGPILDRMASGGVIVIDEIDANLHPRLVSEVVRLFQSPITNPRQAQLILSTHDVTIMMNTGDYRVLRRDQLWFVEKNESGVSHLKSLWDLHPREGEVYSRRYLLGDYGAVPRIDYHDFLDLWSMDGVQGD